MQANASFNDFHDEIKPTVEQRAEMAESNNELRARLELDAETKEVLVDTFVQGSYRRYTSLKGSAEHKCDVDVVVVTNMPREAVSARAALEFFRGFLERNYKGKFEPQGRPWGIQVSKIVKLDLVPTSAPSEANKVLFEAARRVREQKRSWSFEEPELADWGDNDYLVESMRAQMKAQAEWRAEPLWIPDREAISADGREGRWEETDPLRQIQWTIQKNGSTSGNYTRIVRCLKWWRRHRVSTPKYPKSYPLEHLIGQACPNGTASIADGVVRALEAVVEKHRGEASTQRTPHYADHGVPSNNVFARISGADFSAFYAHVENAAKLARRASDAPKGPDLAIWYELFGDPFPRPPRDDGGRSAPLPPAEPRGGYTPREGPSAAIGGRFA